MVRLHEVREVVDDVAAVVGAEDGAEPTDGRQRQQGTGEGERKWEKEEIISGLGRNTCLSR